MKKVLVIGAGGAGKSTLARRLGAALKLEVIHLDKYYWRPGWVETAKDEWERTVAALCARDAWVMDGNYLSTLAQRLQACDTVIFLDFARTLCLWRVVKRRILYRADTRPDMAAGCTEQLDLEFLRWIWTYARRTRPEVVARLAEHAQGKQIIYLRKPAEVEQFLAACTAAKDNGGVRR